jgi:hypothetical protein
VLAINQLTQRAFEVRPEVRILGDLFRRLGAMGRCSVGAHWVQSRVKGGLRRHLFSIGT